MIFLQHVTDGLGLEFKEIVLALEMDFIPALFGNNLITNDLPRQLACLPVKRMGLAIPNPTATTESNRTASMVISSHLITAL
jgi:hypothetical protein